MNDNPTCLIIGAGAIGKAVGGWAFRSAGFPVVFTDVRRSVLDDIARRGGYSLLISETDKATRTEFIGGVRAAYPGSPELREAGLGAEYICTAVGERNFDGVISEISGWIPERGGRRLYLLLLENIEGSEERASGIIRERLGRIPERLTIKATCIERMSRVVAGRSGEYDVLCEQAFPVILSRKGMEDSALGLHGDEFSLVPDIGLYYKRKLYLGNLAHAVTGYFGAARGYGTVMEAMGDEEIRTLLVRALDEAASALARAYPDEDDGIAAYRDSRIVRIMNAPLDDRLSRIARSPMRKLGARERMCAPASDCLRYGIFPEAILRTIKCAASYWDADDPECREMKRLMDSGGIATVLEKAGGFSPSSALVKAVYDV